MDNIKCFKILYIYLFLKWVPTLGALFDHCVLGNNINKIANFMVDELIINKYNCFRV